MDLPDGLLPFPVTLYVGARPTAARGLHHRPRNTSNPARVNETCGVSTALIKRLLSGEMTEEVHKFLYCTEFSPAVVDLVVTFVRCTDTPDAYDMGRSFVRGQPVGLGRDWVPKGRIEEQSNTVMGHACMRQDPLANHPNLPLLLEHLFYTLHWKRASGATRTPPDSGNGTSDILIIVSRQGDAPEATGNVYDVTASDDPVRKSLAMRVPVRRRNCFVVADEASPLYKRACLHCNNRALPDAKKNFAFCERCRTARYCSAACQAADWVDDRHKGAECKRMRETLK